jgi:hypothetical protein
MIHDGHGRHLYHRGYLRTVTEENYPRGMNNPKEGADSDRLMSWIMGHDDEDAPEIIGGCAAPLASATPLEEAALLAAGSEQWTEEHLRPVTRPHIGGLLYPPIHPVLFAPLSSIPPRLCFRVVQVLNLVLIFFNGWVAARMTSGRVWWPVATLVLMIFPGYGGALDLGQNATLSMTFLLTGWWQLRSGRPVLAGVLWGLLAYKPVWAVVFLMVPLVTGRWRMVMSMGLTGLAQILLTVPIVGWQSWFDWLEVGRSATHEYMRQENWIVLSRDLQSQPRRWMLTFKDGLAQNADYWLPTFLGTALWIWVALTTLLVALWQRQRIRALEGPAIAFVLLGAFFSCFHFMYYDVLLAALPVCLLFTDPGAYLRPVFWPRPLGNPELLPYYRPSLRAVLSDWLAGRQDTVPPLPLMPEGQRRHWVWTPVPLLLLIGTIVSPAVGVIVDPAYRFPAVDTYCLLLLWAWCGWRTIFDMDRPVEAPADMEKEGSLSASHNGLAPTDVSFTRGLPT